MRLMEKGKSLSKPFAIQFVRICQQMNWGKTEGEGNRHNGTRLTRMIVSSDRKWAEEQGDHEV